MKKKPQKKTTKNKTDDAVKWEDWMPIVTPCTKCECSVKGEPILQLLNVKSHVVGCRLSMDGLGKVTSIGDFRDPHKECSEFRESKKK